MSDYKNIPTLINDIAAQAKNLEDGKLSINELTAMLENSRAIHERLTILRYKAITNGQSTKEGKVNSPSFTEQQIMNEISTKPASVEDVKEEAPAIEEEGFSFSFSTSDEIVDETPVQQRSILDQINETPANLSVNDKLANEKALSVGEQLQNSKIDDLRTVIGINQKFLFMNDLFEGEKSNYDYALDKINSLGSKQAVDQFLNNDLATKYNWDSESESVNSFKLLVDRKFS